MCERSVAVTKAGKIGPHTDPNNLKSFRCEGVGTLTVEDVRRAEIARLAELVKRYPKEARDFVAWLP